MRAGRPDSLSAVGGGWRGGLCSAARPEIVSAAPRGSSWRLGVRSEGLWSCRCSRLGVKGQALPYLCTPNRHAGDPSPITRSVKSAPPRPRPRRCCSSRVCARSSGAGSLGEARLLLALTWGGCASRCVTQHNFLPLSPDGPGSPGKPGPALSPPPPRSLPSRPPLSKLGSPHLPEGAPSRVRAELGVRGRGGPGSAGGGAGRGGGILGGPAEPGPCAPRTG